MSELQMVKSSDYSNTSKCDMVMETVLKRIMNGTFRYRTGDRLPAENQLAEEFGVSRATIREAFKKLNTLNIVSIRQGDGTFVEKADWGLLFKPVFSTILFKRVDMDQLYDARIWLEMAAVSMACRNKTAENIEKLRSFILRMDQAITSSDVVSFTELDNKLHMYFFKMANNLVLQSIYVMMCDIIKLYSTRSLKTPQSMEASNTKHKAILEAIEGSDDSMAVLLMRRHIEFSKEQLVKNLDITESGLNKDVYL